MIESEKISLRCWKPDDIPLLAAIRNDIKIQSQLLSRPRGSTDEQVIHWLKKQTTQNGCILLIIALRDNDQAIGYIQVANIDSTDRRGELGITLHSTYQGKGYGSIAIKLMSEFVRKTWNFNKLMLKVRTDNEYAIKSYKKCGFISVGTFHKHTFLDGQWLDIDLMELIFSNENSS
ncbi:hypothetical protein A9404_10295 [Halothiobacillus diazotrophicus]|uniref:N-acetyltransferase domain-containing protein n=1 Tax=Halothiobacillus diazotrophicus TaxID=1860122 RepID=A0A191ZII2_9GAMM|nr:GNAT family protein [Halothiobacillus diazotrophicus]ANJ67711.1 hypothetical protein A9404_10295 [Halothiobacillus diazotrophicus]